MIKVAILPSDSSACGWYRLFQPMLELRRLGEVELFCDVAKLDQTTGAIRLQPVGHLPFDGIFAASQAGQFGLSERSIDQADVVVIQKSGGKTTGHQQELSFLETVQAHRRKMVYEIDDLLEHVTPDNPCYAEETKYHAGYAGRMRELMRACRLVTCTTPRLADEMRRITPDVRVVPNGVDLALWGAGEVRTAQPPEAQMETSSAADPVPPPDANVRIGWLCSRNHVADSDILIKPFKIIAKRHPHVTVVMAGAFYPKLKEALGDRLEFHNGVPLTRYPEFARRLRLDIGVAPLVGTRFDAGKSPLKLLEYSALGIPGLASYVGPYKDVDCLGSQSGLTSAQRWVDALDHLIRHPSAREAVAATQRRVMSERFTLQHSSDAWLDVLREVCAP